MTELKLSMQSAIISSCFVLARNPSDLIVEWFGVGAGVLIFWGNQPNTVTCLKTNSSLAFKASYLQHLRIEPETMAKEKTNSEERERMRRNCSTLEYQA